MLYNLPRRLADVLQFIKLNPENTIDAIGKWNSKNSLLKWVKISLVKIKETIDRELQWQNNGIYATTPCDNYLSQKTPNEILTHFIIIKCMQIISY